MDDEEGRGVFGFEGGHGLKGFWIFFFFFLFLFLFVCE
jgi:hypothetical protein